MDEEIERLVVSVRADTTAFSRDVAAMRGELEGPLASGVSRAGRMIEGSLARAVTSGKIGFDDLRRVAMSAMASIAEASLRSVMNGGPAGGGLAVLGSLGSVLGLPGRATGGPVDAGRPYLVGERGPEVFVPRGGGRIEQLAGRPRDIRVSISIHGKHGSEPQALQQSSRQIARAVRSAMQAAR